MFLELGILFLGTKKSSVTENSDQRSPNYSGRTKIALAGRIVSSRNVNHTDFIFWGFFEKQCKLWKNRQNKKKNVFLSKKNRTEIREIISEEKFGRESWAPPWGVWGVLGGSWVVLAGQAVRTGRWVSRQTRPMFVGSTKIKKMELVGDTSHASRVAAHCMWLCWFFLLLSGSSSMWQRMRPQRGDSPQNRSPKRPPKGMSSRVLLPTLAPSRL